MIQRIKTVGFFFMKNEYTLNRWVNIRHILVKLKKIKRSVPPEGDMDFKKKPVC